MVKQIRSITLTQVFGSIPGLRPWRQWFAWKLMILLGVSSAIALVPVAINPPAAQAYTARVVLLLSRRPGEPYNDFVQRATAVAEAGIQRSFAADLLTTETIVVMIGENYGVSIPLMEVQVTRNDWQERPEAAYWARYHESVSPLLNF